MCLNPEKDEKPMEKFPKMRTIPSGWNLPENITSPDSKQTDDPDSEQLSPIEKFPSTRTIPKGWNLPDYPEPEDER